MNTNQHHLFFQKRHYGYSNRYGWKLRRTFVYELPVELHANLHKMIDDIPPPPEWEEKEMLRQYNFVKAFIDRMSPDEVCLWLASLSKSEPFIACMEYQAQILREG